MTWDTIEALNDIGVEFIYHSSSHISYADITKEEVEKDIIRGVKEMEEHELNHRLIHWRANAQQEKCEVGKNYFDGGITNVYASDVLNGDKSNPMMVQDYWCYDIDKYYTYNQLVALINTVIENNG